MPRLEAISVCHLVLSGSFVASARATQCTGADLLHGREARGGGESAGGGGGLGGAEVAFRRRRFGLGEAAVRGCSAARPGGKPGWAKGRGEARCKTRGQDVAAPGR